MMKIATILFTYNRPVHTQKVLEALSRNDIKPQKLIIFQDGMKHSTVQKDWETVGEVIKGVNWCETEIIRSDWNKGLADSVVSGVNYVLEFFDAVIVLEDDCVPHPQFMEYMVEALDKYENSKQVYSIGASAEPVEIENEVSGMDAYFLGRCNSWGWATWKDRWQIFSRDYRILGRIKKNPELDAWMHIWGEDLEDALLKNLYGTFDSWAAFWALAIISRKGYCLAPYESLVTNIGFDGTGVHCGCENQSLRIRSEFKRSKLSLPDSIELIENYKAVFMNYYLWSNPQQKLKYYNEVAYGWMKLLKCQKSIAQYLASKNIANISIWGKGQLCDWLLEDVSGQIIVDAIIQTEPQEKDYQGIPVRSYKDIPEESQLIVVIPGYIMNRIQMLAGRKFTDRLMPVKQLIQSVQGGEQYVC